MSSKNTTDLTQGSVFKRLLLFTLPLLATNLLQQLYNAADVAVVGRFAGETSLAAVGATSGITTLLLNIFIGLATGANVVCANLYGARKKESLSRRMHTATLLSLVCAIGCLRGIGQSTGPTILNAFCITVPRILWVLVVFPLNPTFLFLYICYPIS